ncbi:hypothetical protein STEG23_004662, partial [Scotinomys teguina]
DKGRNGILCGDGMIVPVEGPRKYKTKPELTICNHCLLLTTIGAVTQMGYCGVLCPEA